MAIITPEYIQRMMDFELKKIKLFQMTEEEIRASLSKEWLELLESDDNEKNT